MISKKIDIFYSKKLAAFEVSVNKREEGKIKEIYCNYGKINNNLFLTLDENVIVKKPLIINDSNNEELQEEPEGFESNIFPYEEGKFLVITIPFLFTRYEDGSINPNSLGIGKSKINLKEKNKIIPASFSLQEIGEKLKPVDFPTTFSEEEKEQFCEFVAYEVDLVLYAEDIQYFKGDINFEVSLYAIRDIKSLEGEPLYPCQNPIEAARDRGIELRDPEYYCHIHFFAS